MAKLRLESLLSDLGAKAPAKPDPAPAAIPVPPASSVPADPGPPDVLPAARPADGAVTPIPVPESCAKTPSEAPTANAVTGLIDITFDDEPQDAAVASGATDATDAAEPLRAAEVAREAELALEAATSAADALAESLPTGSEAGSGEEAGAEVSEALCDTVTATGSASASLYDPDADDAPAGDLRSLVLAREIATPKQVQAADTIMKQSTGKRLIDLLLEQGVDEVALFEALAKSLRLGFRRIDPKASESHFDDKLVHRLTPEFCKQNAALPLGVEQGRTVLATSRPDDVFLVDEVKRRLGARSVLVVVVPPCDLKLAMAPLEAESVQEMNVDEILGDIEEDDVRVEKSSNAEVDLEREAGESPVIRYVNYIIQTASKEGASDIHIEPGDKSLKVRFRIDGELYEMMQPPAKMAAAITSRLKIMGNLDISERRLPQDGRIRCTVQNRKLDLRMSTLPSTYGEKVVLRILDTKSINVTLDMLGFNEETLTNWKHQIDQPHGIVLVTGPTGSGKTTTLYASLRQMDKQSMNISTVEDPVEYHLEGVTQTQMHEKIGMTFARALKALLRQDPDVILVGEIRDQETAHTAVQAALTGHLVLSTLHTNDAPSSITRLVNIGIEPFLLGAAVNAALAQRLVRRVCPGCKQPAQFTDEMREFVEAQGMDPSLMFEGKGCDKCRNSGYTGRLGIYELLCVDDHLRDIIARNPNVSEFRRMCLERGMVSLRQDGFYKAGKGQTTVQEIIRATESAV
jgi:type IV pilus assembly protein PilB